MIRKHQTKQEARKEVWVHKLTPHIIITPSSMWWFGAKGWEAIVFGLWAFGVSWAMGVAIRRSFDYGPRVIFRYIRRKYHEIIS